MTHDELAREFMELNNLDTFPTFFSAGDILEVMKKRDDYYYFITTLRNDFAISSINDFIDEYVMNPNKLLLKAVKWCKEHKI